MGSGVLTRCVLACVLLLAVSAVVADAATKRTFKGKTAQGKAISFTVTGKSLASLKFTIDLPCSDGSTLTDVQSGFQATTLGKKNRFSDDQVGKTDEVVFKGQVKGKKVKGSLTVTDQLNSSVKCGPKTVKFSVKRR
jgi:hypothetical protein